MTSEEFAESYARGSGLTMEEFNSGLVVLPCDCGDWCCEGWQAMSRKHYEFITQLEGGDPRADRQG